MDVKAPPKAAERQANGRLGGGSAGGGEKAPPKTRARPGAKAKTAPKRAKGAAAVPGARGLDEQLHRAEMLLGISREVAGIESLDEVLEKLVEITSRETDCERSTLFLNDEQTGELYSRAAQGEKSREIRLLNTSGIAGHVFTTGEGLIIDDAYSDPRFNRAIDKQTGFETKSVMCAPVRTVKGEIIGVAQALNKSGGGKFTAEDLSLLEAMTTQAAVALQSHQFVERMRKSRETELEFLDVVADVTSEIDLTVLLQKVMGEATRMLRADRSTLFLNNEKTNELWSKVGGGLDAIEIRLPNHLGIAGAVFTSGKTINIPYAYADLRFNPAFDKKTGYFTRSILCVPVVNKAGKVIGVTQVLNKRGGAFNDEDESRLKAFTGQVSIALENAKLFDDVQNIKNYNESMLESMSNAVVTTNEDGLIVTCNKAGYRIMQVKAADIVGKPVVEFFSGASNSWVADKVKEIEETNTSFEMMDAEMEFAGERVSVNVTIQPLVSTEGKKLGVMLMLEDISSEKRMKSTMARYMDPGIAAKLMGSGKEDDILGGKSAVATVMFTDIRGFTPITESLGAQGTVGFLNDYFTLMVEEIAKLDGMLDKFIGDAIMACFGLPIPHDDDEDRAVRASINMVKSLWTWNEVRKGKGQLPADMGIGLNTDEVVSGNIGSPKRMNYTLIGDGVNLAARLESACKQYGARILISENTYRRLKGTYRIRDIDDVVVIGKTQPVGVHEVLDYHSDETFPNLMDVVNHFREGRKHYRAGNWEKAIRSFTECLKANENDKLSKLYVERCERLKAEAPADWDGVWRMTSK